MYIISVVGRLRVYSFARLLVCSFVCVSRSIRFTPRVSTHVAHPETTEIIADAEKAEAPEEEEQVDEKVVDGVQTDRNTSEPHAPEKHGEEEAEDNADDKDDDGEVPMLDKDFDEGEEVELDVPAEDKFTNDLDPAEKK